MVNNNKVTSFVNALNGLVDGKEDKSNKVTSWSNSTTDAHYPSEKLVKDSLDGKANSTHTHSQYLTEHQDLSNYVTTDDSRLSDARTPTSHTHTKSQITDFPTIPDVSGKEDSSNKVSSWSSTTTDTHYPSEKLVKDSLDGKQEELVSGTNLKTLNGVDLLGEGDIAIDVSCGGSTVIFEDDCSVDNTSDYGSSIPLRSGSSTLAYNSDGYYTITNNSSQAESFIPITDLTGLTTDFTLEYDSYVEQVGGSSGLVIYNSSTAWVKLTDDADSSKKYWYGYNDGSFHETAFYGTETSYQKWVHYKYTVEGNVFSMEVSYNDNIISSYTCQIGFTRDSTTKIGLDCEWQRNTVTRYKNIVVKTNTAGSLNSGSENAIYLGDDIMTMIDTALGHMITNWEDYE